MLSKIENATSLEDTLSILDESYLKIASNGLKDYLEYEKRNNKRDIEQEYLKIIRSFPKYFKSQKPV